MTDQDFILITGYGLTIEEKFQVDLKRLMEMFILILFKGSYAEVGWHNAISTFDDMPKLLILYIDCIEVTTDIPKIGTTPENNGKQPIRVGANYLVEKGIINGNYTGKLDDIKVWNFCFYKITSSQLI